MSRIDKKTQIQLGKIVLWTAIAAMLYPLVATASVLLRYEFTSKSLSIQTIAGIILASFLMFFISLATLFLALLSKGGGKKVAIIYSVAGAVLNGLLLVTQGTV